MMCFHLHEIGVSLLLCFLGFPLHSSAQDVRPFPIPYQENIPAIRDFTLAPDGHTAFVTAQSNLNELSCILQLRKEKGAWSAPVIASFSGTHSDLEPMFSPGGKRLYFVSNRPVPGREQEQANYDIWYVTLQQNGTWAEPVNLGAPINTAGNEFYPSLAANGNLYFTSDAIDPETRDNIYMSIWNGQAYGQPVSLGDSINGAGYEFNAYVAPDESYLLFSGYNRSDGMGSGDLYISQRTDAGWTKAVNLGNSINSTYMDYCPFVDYTGQTLYFTSRRSELKPTAISTTEELFHLFQSHANGLSRLYQANIPQLLEK